MIDKVVGSFDEAVADIPSGATLHVGGFASPFNIPCYLLAAVARQGASNLTAVTTSAGNSEQRGQSLTEEMQSILDWPPDHWDLGLLCELKRITKMITSFPVWNRSSMRYPFENLLESGEATVEVIGQGSLAERIRAARSGIAAFYTPVGPGTFVAEGKEVRDFDGVPHVLEHALHADFALIRARAADRYGNLVFSGPGTFNETMAGAARITIAEVDEVVPLGELAPDVIKTPGVYVQRVVVRPQPPHTDWREPC